jgi:hypothetical protein
MRMAAIGIAVWPVWVDCSRSHLEDESLEAGA